ncbi:MAG: HNH endonuclease, partial [bacterium]
MNLIPVAVDARDVGECIYCGVRDQPLHREHAVPYALNGPWTLLRASCEACAGITHKFERDTLRSLWPSVRNALALQTRRPKERSATLPLVV